MATLLPTARRFGGKMAAMRVFISYRRDDSMVTAALLYKELIGRAEFADAFMDVDDIGYGDDFVAAIDDALRDAEVVLVVIGPRWAEMLQARLRGDDWVRHEVATALRLRAAASHVGRAPAAARPAGPDRRRDASPTSALPGDLAPLARLSMLKFDERALKASINTLLERSTGGLRRPGSPLAGGTAQAAGGAAAPRRRAQAPPAHADRDVSASRSCSSSPALGQPVRLHRPRHARRQRDDAARRLVGARTPPWSGEVVLVGIDEESERAIGRKFDPSWRAEHATVIANAASAAARVVAFDMVLEDAGADAANAALRSALAATREKLPVVFGVQAPRGRRRRGAILAPFAPLVRQGIACAGLDGGQARIDAARHRPRRSRRSPGAASAASGSARPGRASPISVVRRWPPSAAAAVSSRSTRREQSVDWCACGDSGSRKQSRTSRPRRSDGPQPALRRHRNGRSRRSAS